MKTKISIYLGATTLRSQTYLKMGYRNDVIREKLSRSLTANLHWNCQLTDFQPTLLHKAEASQNSVSFG